MPTPFRCRALGGESRWVPRQACTRLGAKGEQDRVKHRSHVHSVRAHCRHPGVLQPSLAEASAAHRGWDYRRLNCWLPRHLTLSERLYRAATVRHRRWWLHRSILTSDLTELYTLNRQSFLYVNHTTVKLFLKRESSYNRKKRHTSSPLVETYHPALTHSDPDTRKLFVSGNQQ